MQVTCECTSVNVPLDHDRPDGPTISPALVRVPASDPGGVRRGSLFLNPGGPGGSGVDFPVEEQQLPLFERGDLLLDDQRTQRGNEVLEHMSTANVAKDLELLRVAVGDGPLNYVGAELRTCVMDRSPSRVTGAPSPDVDGRS